MTNLMKKSASIVLAATLMMSATAFADNPYPETVVMEPCTAIDLLGGIPEEVTGPDREDLEAMLAEIDACMAAGNHEQADQIWEMVYELISRYVTEDPDAAPDFPDLEAYIAEMETTIERLENAGRYEEAQALRAELEQVLDEFNGNPFPEDPDQPGDSSIEEMIHGLEEEAERLEAEGDYEAAEAIRREIEALLGQFDEGFEGKDPVDPPMDELDVFIQEMEDEIRRLDEEGQHDAADQLREELEAFLKGFDHQGDCFGTQGISVEDILGDAGHDLSPQEMDRLQELVDEINAIVNGTF